VSSVETTIASFIKARPATCLPPSASVARAAEAIRSNGAGCVLVIEGERLAGIFTERDFMNRVAMKGRPLEGTSLADVMTADPETLGPDDDIRFAINKMAVGGFRHVPIVDAGGAPIGVLLERDVVNHLTALFAAVELDGDGELDDWVDVGGG
jgi:CBS domain-containing protein